MNKSSTISIKHSIGKMTCTLLIVLGLLVTFSQESQAASSVPPVSSLAAKAVSASQVGLSWSYSDSGSISGYSFERSQSATSGFQTIATASALATSLADSSLSSGKSYYYRMRAYKKYGKNVSYSSYSQVAAATTPATADMTAPTVSISSPASGTTFTSAQAVTVSASAQDNVGVTKVEFYDGSTLKGTDTTSPYTYSWSITSTVNGSHSFTAKAYDAAGNSKVSSAAALTVKIGTADTTAPAVSITSPASGTTFTSAQTVTIAVAAQDNVGVTKVEFYDGSTLKGTDTTSPYTYSWSISSTVNGSHSLTAKAYDAAGNTKVSSLVGVTVNIASAPVASGPLTVFPGAEGFGIGTSAGRGGQIIKVTNLNDSGTGSLRAALEASGPRTVVFEVSGTIHLDRRIHIKNPYLTVAGQTAPSPGVTLANAYLLIKTHDVLIQHLRIRPGDTGSDVLQDRDAITIGYEPGVPVYNIVIDHCSLSWGIDENLDMNRVNNVTVSNSIISEGLNNSYNAKGAHSKALLINPYSTNIAILKNMFAHNSDRHPNLCGGSNPVISVNNLWYDAGVRWTSFSDAYDVGPIIYTAIGNHYIDGPSTNLSWTGSLYYLDGTLATGSKIYQGDTLYEGSGRFLKNSADPSYFVSVPPAWEKSISVMPSSEVESYVLAHAGARPADRDAVDNRIAYEVDTRTGSIIDSPGQVGGWPTLAKNYRPFAIPANPNGDDDGDGYTNVEEILHQMAAQVEGRTN